MTRAFPRVLTLVVALLHGRGAAWGGESVHADGSGRIIGVGYDGETTAVESDVVVALPKWTGTASMAAWCVSDVQYAATNDVRQWTGLIHFDQTRSCRYRQTLKEDGGRARVDLSVTGESDVDIEGVYLFLKFPVEEFSGGQGEARGTNEWPVRVVLPRETPVEPRFLSVTTDMTAITDASRRTRVELSFDQPRAMTFQDERTWSVPRYALFTRFSTNSVLRKGETISIGFAMKVTKTVDRSEVRLSMKPRQVLYTLDGFGGNFVYGIQSPMARYALDTLRIAWARTQMSLSDWEPDNENGSALDTDWSPLEARDVPGSTLRHEFVLAQELQKKGIPFVISVWDLPEWLYADPGRGPGVYGRRVAADKWDELLECVGSYLQYAKRQYGVEPDLFSFNECREGVRIQFTAEEHRDAIKRLGARFEKLGLKTALLLADNASPRGTETYAKPTTEDPEAMRCVGALAVHSWGGASPAEYAAWSDLSKAIHKPLLIAELGVDANAWHTPWLFRTFDYALQELRMYQEILLYARPQGTMEWEFTSDYAVGDVQKEANGSVMIVPGWRYSFIKQFSNLTPAKAKAIATGSDRPNVLFTAFAGTETTGTIYTLHIANLGASRLAAISGLPRDVRSLRAVMTSESDSFKELEPVRARHGKATVNLPAQSLLTLTTGR